MMHHLVLGFQVVNYDTFYKMVELYDLCTSVKAINSQTLALVGDKLDEREIKRRLNEYCKDKNTLYEYHRHIGDTVAYIFFKPISIKKCIVEECYSQTTIFDKKCEMHLY